MASVGRTPTASRHASAWRFPAAGRAHPTTRRPNPAYIPRVATAANGPAATAAATTSAVQEQQQQQQTGAPPYDFERQWYPVGIVEDLDPSKPHAVALLGRDLVVWRDAQGAWRCFHDACPHRLASLSEGRIEPKDGSLQCAYHGWRFDGQGACTVIPQITEPAIHASACSNKKTRAQAHPTQEAQGLLFAWGMSGPSAEAEAAATPLPLMPAMHGDGAAEWQLLFGWYQRDAPYSFNTLLENATDPAHVSYSHHGVQGNREKPVVFNSKLEGEIDRDTGFSLALTPSGQDNPISRLHFRPPGLAWTHSLRANVILVNYAVPTRSGHSRLVTCGLVKSEGLSPIMALVSRMPKWLYHSLIVNTVIDGDAIFLRLAEERLAAAGGSWKKAYHMASSSDGTAVALRRWLDAFGGGLGPCSITDPIQLPRLSREQALDRFNSHTVNCPSCSKAFKTVGQLKVVALAAGVLAVVAASAAAVAAAGAAAAAGLPVMGLRTILGVGPWLGLVALCGLLYGALDNFRKTFVFVDYVHSERK